MKQVIIMQGLSGAGKTHWANKNFPNASVCSADRFFEMGHDEYHFVPSLLGEAHARCLNKYLYALSRGDSTVIVDNTNTQRWEWINYAHIAVKWGYEWAVADIYDSPAALTDEQLAARCKHNVSVEAIARQRERYEPADPSELIVGHLRIESGPTIPYINMKSEVPVPLCTAFIDGWINT